MQNRDATAANICNNGHSVQFPVVHANTNNVYEIGTPLPLPIFNPACMSPDFFVSEMKEFFLWKNIPQAQWVNLIGRVFQAESDISRWWRETKSTIFTWDEFVHAFLRYEKSGVNADSLLQSLFAKRQKLHEAFESFAWDVNSIYKKVNPHTPVEEIIQRILNSCLPEISAMLRHVNLISVENLVITARNVISDLNKIRKIEGKVLFRARQGDIVEQNNSNFGKSKSSFSFSRRNNDSSMPYAKTKSNNEKSQHEPQQHASSQSQSQVQTENVSHFQSQSNTKSNSSSNANKKFQGECFYCNKKGHYLAECRKKKYDDAQSERYQSQSNNASGNLTREKQ
jgi:hypothetical protein